MQKRTIIAIIVIVIILSISAWLFLSTQPSSSNPGGTTPTTNNGLTSLFPFTNKTTPTLEQQQGAGSVVDTTTIPPAEKAPATISSGPLVQVTNRRTAGMTILAPRSVTTVAAHSAKNFATPTVVVSTLPTVRFVERGTGYVYDIDQNGQNENKISGTAVIRASRALFADAGNTVLVEYIKNDNATVATFLGRITPPAAGDSTGSIKGDFLPDNIADMLVSPDGKSLVYLIPIDNGVAGISTKPDNTTKKQLFTSPFTEWLLDMGKTDLMTTTKAAADFPGYAYKITSTGVFQRILGGINGLTTKMSPDGGTILYSIGENGGLSLHALRLKDNSDTDTGLKTLPEKCAWSKDSATVYCGAPNSIAKGAYPDDWYQGTFHFNDALWKMNFSTGITTQVNTGENNNLDATNMILDSTGKYLFFINKNDGSLWSLAL